MLALPSVPCFGATAGAAIDWSPIAPTNIDATAAAGAAHRMPEGPVFAAASKAQRNIATPLAGFVPILPGNRLIGSKRCAAVAANAGIKLRP